MLQAIVEGKHDPGWMADCAKTSRSKKKELELALDGSFTQSRRWLLDKELHHLARSSTSNRRAKDFGVPLNLGLATIPELLNGHVTVEVECLDRLYVNGYIRGWRRR